VKDNKADASVDSTRSNTAERASLHFARLGEILLDIERSSTLLGLESETGSIGNAAFATEQERQFYQDIVSSTLGKLHHVAQFPDSSSNVIFGRSLSVTPVVLASAWSSVEGRVCSSEGLLEPLSATYELKAAKVESKALSSVLRNVVLTVAEYESNTAFAKNLALVDGVTNRCEVDQRENIGLIIPSAISGAPPEYA
jgi:hypothetical protein